MSYTITVGGTTINTTTNTMPYLLARSLRVSLRADRRNSCAFTVVTTAAVFVPRVGQNVVIQDGVETIFGGVIKSCPVECIGAVLGSNTPVYIDVMSDGYSSIPSRRTITAYYTNVSCGYIVTDYITKFLSEESIAAGTVSAGVTLATYRKGAMSLNESLDELANISGHKWYIDDAKQLQFKQEDAIVAAAHDIVEGSAFTDFRDIRVEENLALYRNKQVIRGGTLEDGSILVYSKQLDAEIAARQALEGGSGVYGNVFDDTNILTEANAEVAADNLLKRYGKVPISLIFNSDATDWRAGTKLMANLPTFGISVNTYFLIEEISITDLSAGRLRFFIAATRRDDVSFSTQRTGDYIDYFADLIRSSKAASDFARPDRGIAYYIDGTLAVGLKASLKAPIALKIKGVLLEVDTAPTGADLIVDVNKNDTTVYTTQANRPRITAGSKTGTGITPDVTAIAKGDKITVEIDQVGSTIAGGNLSVTVVCEVG